MVKKKQEKTPFKGWAGEISEIRPGLFLSGARAIRPKNLADFKISCIINATVELPEVSLEKIEVIPVRISDSQTTSIYPFLSEVADKIESVLSVGGRILVHCVAGVSRSATLILAYLVKYKEMSLREAFLLVKSVRPVVRPNSNFFKQLIDFELECRCSNSVSLIHIPGSPVVIPDVCEDELKLFDSNSWTQIVRERRNYRNHFA